jgi:ubiquinone/menaquinone biosynthesis C-methylase UbiE
VSQLVFDEDQSRRIEAMYRIGDAVRRRRLARAALGAAPGERVLDVGCGPGFYCEELLEEVGPDGAVVGVDSSDAMLALARRRSAGHENVEFHEADATALPVADASFDAALSVQVQEYVGDVDGALRELYRVLRPGGRVLVWDVDWATLSFAGERELTARVVSAWDEHLAHPSLPRTLAPRLRAAGFEDVAMEAHPFTALGFDPDSYGAAIVPFMASFVSGRQGIAEAEAQGWEGQLRALDAAGGFYFAVTQFCFTAAKPR